MKMTVYFEIFIFYLSCSVVKELLLTFIHVLIILTIAGIIVSAKSIDVAKNLPSWRPFYLSSADHPRPVCGASPMRLSHEAEQFETLKMLSGACYSNHPAGQSQQAEVCQPFVFCKVAEKVVMKQFVA